jgi:cell division protein FtsA
MNTESNLIAAIDIGTTKIVAIAGRRNPDGSLEVLGIEKVASTGVKRGVVLNIDETVAAISEVVKRLESKLKTRLTNVYVGIAGQHIRSLRNTGYKFIDISNEIKQSDLEQLFDDNYKIAVDPSEKILHVIAQDYKVDSETGIKNPVGMSGHRLEGSFHIVIGQINSVKNLEKCIQRLGNIQLNGTILEPLAASEAVLTEEEKEAGVVLVDIGGGTTDIAVYHDGIIRHTAVIPLGGNVVTNDIKEGCNVLTRQAEMLKVQYGSAMGDNETDDRVVTIPGIAGWEPKEISFRNLAYIIQARMEEIIEFVKYHIELSGYYEKLGAGIVLTGGGAGLRALPQLVSLQTGLNVRIGKADIRLSGMHAHEFAHPVFATSVGLLLSVMNRPVKKVVEQSLFDADEIPSATPTVERKPLPRKEAPKRVVREMKTGTLFESIKNGLSGLFDERDSEM